MMCERARVARPPRVRLLAKKQLVQEMIAESWIELEQFRLLVLRTAWKIDQYHDYKRVRGDISAVKAAMPRVLHDIASRALQIHGSLGVTDEMPFADDGAQRRSTWVSPTAPPRCTRSPSPASC